MSRTVVALARVLVLAAAVVAVPLKQLCAERDAAAAAGDHALVREIECRVQDELIACQPKTPALPRLCTLTAR